MVEPAFCWEPGLNRTNLCAISGASGDPRNCQHRLIAWRGPRREGRANGRCRRPCLVWQERNFFCQRVYEVCLPFLWWVVFNPHLLGVLQCQLGK